MLFLSLMASVRFGAAQIGTMEVISAFTDYDGSEEDLIIRIVGVNAEAGLAAVTLIVVFSSVPSTLLPLAAFGGAFAVAVLLYLLAWRGSSSPLRLILIGIRLGAIATALTTTMIVFCDIFQVSKALVWLTGSVYGRTWEHIYLLLPWLVVFVPLSFTLSRNLNALNLGEEVDRGLGSRIEIERGVLLLCSVARRGGAPGRGWNLQCLRAGRPSGAVHVRARLRVAPGDLRAGRR